MKRQLHVSKFAVFFVATALLLLQAACSKGTSEESVAGDMTEITVNLTGIEGEVSEELLLQSSAGRKSQSAQLLQGETQAYSFPAFDAQVEQPVDDDYAVNGLPKVNQVRNTAGGKRMAAVPLAPRVRYRIVLYRANGTFHDSQQGIVGSPLRINVARGETYTWYAYSYNDTLDVADLANYNNPVVPTGTTRDLITASGTRQITASGNTPLNVVLQHRTNRVAVEVNTMGMFSTLSAVTVTLGGNYFTSGTCDLRTGAVSGASTYTTPVLTAANLPNLPGTTTGDQKVAYYYTLSNTAIPTMRVTLTNLSVTPYGTATPRNFTGQQAAFQFNVTAFAALGGSKKARIDLIESPLTLGTARWARNNLYLNGNSATGHNPYRFYATNGSQTARESFWPWRGLLPSGQAGTGDPCRQVYPANAWRTPSPDEYQSILPTAHTFVSTGNRHINYTAATGIGAPYAGTQLTFYANGFGNVLGLIGGVLNVSLSYNHQNTRAHLWADDQVINVVAGIGTYFYLMTDKPAGVIPALDPAEQSTQVSVAVLNNISLLGISLLESGYRNVRCVRNPAVPTTTVP
ncbi:hypothetical protein [Sphingobacterium griseoflavum]|uniref:Major fimbrial subunit protein N-terminal domain-containing protein n=1 Tax=Sphingobacterium griseoflavum TaxID=1474952 RepID=A0ABQ3HW91_9SPHI|nr:hypothetical protein [Sphingobacterium griseoflavum]GHE39872.1 hypothetical protein GCM10017764_24020 [Sphingobacterium griseoflavum]